MNKKNNKRIKSFDFENERYEKYKALIFKEENMCIPVFDKNIFESYKDSIVKVEKYIDNFKFKRSLIVFAEKDELSFRRFHIPMSKSYLELCNFMKENLDAISDLIWMYQESCKMFIQNGIVNNKKIYNIYDLKSAAQTKDTKISNKIVNDYSENYQDILRVAKRKFKNKISSELNKKSPEIMYIDISNFYDSIYTHDIERLVDFTNDQSKDQRMKMLSDLDLKIRNSNGGISKGILVGTPISKIISELLLSKICYEIESQLKSKEVYSVVISRFADDFVVICYESDRPKIIGVFRDILSTYNLNINKSKFIDRSEKTNVKFKKGFLKYGDLIDDEKFSQTKVNDMLNKLKAEKLKIENWHQKKLSNGLNSKYLKYSLKIINDYNGKIIGLEKTFKSDKFRISFLNLLKFDPSFSNIAFEFLKKISADFKNEVIFIVNNIIENCKTTFMAIKLASFIFQVKKTFSNEIVEKWKHQISKTFPSFSKYIFNDEQFEIFLEGLRKNNNKNKEKSIKNEDLGRLIFSECYKKFVD